MIDCMLRGSGEGTEGKKECRSRPRLSPEPRRWRCPRRGFARASRPPPLSTLRPAPGVPLKNGIYYRNKLARLENELAAPIQANANFLARGGPRTNVRRLDHIEVSQCLVKTWHNRAPVA